LSNGQILCSKFILSVIFFDIIYCIFAASNETETSSAGEQLVRDKFDE